MFLTIAQIRPAHLLVSTTPLDGYGCEVTEQRWFSDRGFETADMGNPVSFGRGSGDPFKKNSRMEKSETATATFVVSGGCSCA
ncbi:unnamed protein product [Microthlaspi erraticum]|uniref:Uncharacterized protein n=1 Tax=Microthlaspi erraticum TaxID=1685480 RepID=A0A6D2IWC7_9BRAS|nr:unnamed protein product [Microthlaspi erraticum]